MSCTAAVDSYAATISEVVGEELLLYLKEELELTINVQRQRWKKKTTRILLGEVLENIFRCVSF
jgi:GTPase Era involved in 16S rRNA processing